MRGGLSRPFLESMTLRATRTRTPLPRPLHDNAESRKRTTAVSFVSRRPRPPEGALRLRARAMSFLRRKRRGKPSAAPAAEAAPPSPPPASPTRDGYGFVVKPAFADAYRAHVPMFVREEEERRERWMAFLERASHPTSPVAAEHASASGDGRDPRRHGAPAVLSSSGSGLDAVEEILRNRDRGACSADAPRRERELESLVRGGVPMAIRGELWQLCLRVDEVRVPGAYQTLAALVDDDVNDHLYCEDAKDAKDGASLDVPLASSEEKEEARRSFVWSAQKTWGPLTKHTREQIAKDVPRTFPGHAQLDSLPMRKALERVLRAFAVASPSVGYCQGMNFIAGVFLLLMEEEAAFWSLSQVLRLILPDYFEVKGAMKAHLVDQEVLRELAEVKTPALVKALDENGCPLHAVASAWFMALFANALPWETCLRVWDVTLFERTRVPLFQTALAVMELDQMTTRKSSSRVFETATTMASRAFDASALVMHATCGHADVTWRLLEALCAKHAARMEREGRFDDDTKETSSAHDDACTEDDARTTSPARLSSVQKDFQDATFLTDRDPTRRPDVDASDADSRGWRTPGVPAPATRAKVVASPASRRNVGSGGSRGSRSSERRWRDVLAKGAGVSRLRADAEREKKSSAERERAERERAERGDDFEDVETRFLPDDELLNSRRPEENASRLSAAADLSPSSARVFFRATESSSSERGEVARLQKELRVALRRADDAEKASSSTSATLKTTLEALADRDRAVARLSAQTKELLAMLHERDAETIERHRAASSGRMTRTEGARTSSAPSAS